MFPLVRPPLVMVVVEPASVKTALLRDRTRPPLVTVVVGPPSVPPIVWLASAVAAAVADVAAPSIPGVRSTEVVLCATATSLPVAGRFIVRGDMDFLPTSSRRSPDDSHPDYTDSDLDQFLLFD